MRRISKRRAKRNRQVSKIRKGLIRRVRKCELCQHGPKRPSRSHPLEGSLLACHEIARGIHRSRALDQPYALLVVCWLCNSHLATHPKEWPESRQLAVLRASRPDDYDLEAYNLLVNPNAPERITQDEVDQWRGKIWFRPCSTLDPNGPTS